jgi:cytochrome P450
VDIPDGATGLGWIQAANLDPEAFSEPHRFQIDRSPNHHIAFGYGEHFCLGAWLARRAARVTLEEWLARVGSFEALDAEGIEPIPDFLVRGPSALHVAVQPRT